MGAFSLKFQKLLAAKLLIGSKKVRGCKSGGRTSSITKPSMVGILGRAPAVDEKVWCFLSVCFVVTLWNDEVCDNGNAMKQCNFQNHYGVITYRKVCSCAPIFNFFCGSPKFSLRGKFIRKIAIFCDFWGCRPTFLKREQWNLVWRCWPGTPSPKFGTRVRAWEFLPHAKFCKNRLRGANLYQKLPILVILAPVSLHF